jgi:hypothetical protein
MSTYYLDLKVNCVELTVFYKYSKERDPFGTGDSPTEYNVELLQVEAVDSTINLIEVLQESVLEEIEAKIIEENR